MSRNHQTHPTTAVLWYMRGKKNKGALTERKVVHLCLRGFHLLAKLDVVCIPVYTPVPNA